MGSEDITIYHHQHLSKAVAVKASKKAKNRSNPSPSWSYDQMKGTVSAYDNVKVHHRQSSKPAKPNSPQQFYGNPSMQFTPVAVIRSMSHNETSNQGYQLKSFAVPEQRLNFGGRQHQSTRNSPVKGQPFQTPPRQTTATPPMVYSHSQASSPKTILATTGKPFYAGAKFESHPSHMVLPTPPSHWTAPLQRSQSQPSSPTLKSMQKGVTSAAIDLTSLFGSANPGPVAKSFPGERMMQALMRAEEKKINLKLALESKEVSSDEESASSTSSETGSDGEKTDIIKKEVSNEIRKVDSDQTLKMTCHASVTPNKSYNEMSAQLKFLMNVAA